jgi:hypothetical protein
MNLDMLVRAGQPPWHPAPTAVDIDVWDKYEFPICGSYRLDGRLVIFTLITTAGTRSLWAYVPSLPRPSWQLQKPGSRLKTSSTTSSPVALRAEK